ncbi:zinc-regulated TonB-dependent outer membrane receptor [Corallococcus praedator]|uniref:Zinc-regulated TonB-dependent outer membrane receptor n=1 Tax=Corallococcus praedator TaxID=2316724 RepID=A0ABX9Q8H4_9BACT|nr:MULTISPECIES: zinc-regulated TonB-dependent outer membrane receptor [Corallococcus]RKH28376.1 zinc-regulated TonB-dependent outer membrane receptor [Corallococcus sp. CA031C]RKH93426.1 zinc-regulated TonB-dependent outer membrane receptor [Corallococcus praedator]
MSFLPRRNPRALAVVLAVQLSTSAAWAQSSPGQTPPAATETPPPPAEAAPADTPSDAPALSAEEMAEIEKALGSDASTRARPSGDTSPVSPTATNDSGVTPLRLPNAITGGTSFLNLSFILDLAVAAFSSKEPLQGGAHDPTQNGFNLQQLELSIGSVVDPYFRFDSNIVFSQFGVEIEEAYVTTLDLPANLQVRAGQFLTRFGRLNSTHPHAWDFVDQPFVMSRVFGAEGNRGLGVEGSWLTPLPWYVEVIGSATDAKGEATARSFFGSSNERVLSPLDFQLTGAVKQFFPLSDDLSLLWGLSAATGPNPTGYRNHTSVYGTDVYLKFRPITEASAQQLVLQAEVLYRRRQAPEDLLSDWGGYAQTVWRFSNRWATGVRYEFGTPAKTQEGRVANDPLDPEWIADRQRITAAVTFWPTEFSRLRLQAATDRVGWRATPDYSAFLALEVVTGAHGAHAF